MTLEARLISNSNAFFTRETRQPLIPDEYQKQFETDLMTTKKAVNCANSLTTTKNTKPKEL